MNTAIIYLKKEKKRLDKHSISPEMDIRDDIELNPKDGKSLIQLKGLLDELKEV